MRKTEFRIRLLGDPALRRKASPVKEITAEHREILSQMARLMYAGAGVGLAAPQVGINQAMIVADVGKGLYKLINPRIIQKQGFQVNTEGCLSIPGICLKIKRAKRVILKALDEDGKPLSLEAEDLLACVFQHEIDHLKGKVIVDYVSVLEKLKIRQKLKVLKERDENLSESKRKFCQLQL